MKKYIVLATCIASSLFALNELDSDTLSLMGETMHEEAYEEDDHQAEEDGSASKGRELQQPENRVNVYHALYDDADEDEFFYEKDDPFHGFYLGISGSFGQWGMKQYESGNWSGGVSDSNGYIGRAQAPLILNTGYDWVWNLFFLGGELEGIWFASEITDNVDGSYLGDKYWEHNRVTKPWQVNLNARFGVLMSPYSTLYCFIGPAWSDFKTSQEYKFTATSSSVNQSNSNTEVGGNFGIGVGTLFTSRIEFHVRGEYSQFSSYSLSEVHGDSRDKLKFKPQSVLVLFNLVFRL